MAIRIKANIKYLTEDLIKRILGKSRSIFHDDDAK